MAKNTEGINVSVKHYLNTKLKPQIKRDHNGNSLLEAYPLYVQLVALGQSTRMRSILGSFVAEEDFEKFQQKYIDDLSKERKILIEDVRNAYKESQDENFNFQLKWTIISGYSAQSHEFDKLVGDELNAMLRYTLQEVVDRTMIPLERSWHRAKYNYLPERRLTDSEFGEAVGKYYSENGQLEAPDIDIHNVMTFNNTDDANFISLLFSNYIPSIKMLRDKFSSELWDLHSYVEKIKREKDIHLITIDDWFTGEFDRLFMDVWDDERSLRAIHNGFEAFRKSCSGDIAGFINEHDPSSNS